MSRVYAVTFENVTVSAAQDFFEISPADDKPVRLLGLLLSQSSDTGDSAEELLRVKVIRGHTSSGSVGTAPTPVPVDAIDTAAGFTAEVNNTTIASSGTTVDLFAYQFNIRAGLEFFWTPETAPHCSQAQTTIVVRLMAAPADALTMAGTLYVEEVT